MKQCPVFFRFLQTTSFFSGLIFFFFSLLSGVNMEASGLQALWFIHAFPETASFCCLDPSSNDNCGSVKMAASASEAQNPLLALAVWKWKLQDSGTAERTQLLVLKFESVYFSMQFWGFWWHGRYRVVQTRVEMGSIEEQQLLCCENSCRRFSGQNWEIYGAALADGVQRVHEILAIGVIGIAEVER